MAGQKVIYLVSTGSEKTWTIPADFGTFQNVFVVGSGRNGTVQRGGAGASWAESDRYTGLSFSPGQTVYYRIVNDQSDNAPTYFSTISGGPTSYNQGAKAVGGTATSGGSAALSIGTVTYSGGSPGSVTTGTNFPGSGGGGAGSSAGAGKNGGTGGSATNYGAGGGGGVGGPSSTAGGSANTSAGGGAGGKGPSAASGGAGATSTTVATNPTVGGGGGGGGGARSSYTGFTNGTNGSTYAYLGSDIYGPGAGGGGASAGIAGNGGGYGGGGGGSAATGTPGQGTQGLIIFVYDSVDPTITINTQPSNKEVTEPAGATFSISATASFGTLTYQWQTADAATPTSWSNISGANSSSYTKTPTSFATDNGDLFRCVVGVSGTAVTSTSNSATLTVKAASTGNFFMVF